ncbi:MAG: 2OG-Fe(II) oxygenase [Saprospiraceae bacterium]
MLVYEPGDFFLPHKDSEKAKGMFGTLVVGLPCDHAGGELLIRFGGQEVVADFSSLKGAARIPFAAFFADCEHEICPLQAGYRVCLTFNLIQDGVPQPVRLDSIDTEIDALAAILKEMTPHFDYRPKVVLLQHEYTPANFSLLAGERAVDGFELIALEFAHYS